MNNKNELLILNIIKYGPIVFILSLSVIISLTLYINYKSAFIEEKDLIEKEYVQRNRTDVKNQLDTIYRFILEEQKTTEIKLKKNLKQRVNEAHSIAMNIYNENKHLKKEVVQKMIKDALRNIRFNEGRGYFFIYSFDYECILLPVAKHLEGSSFYNFKDGEGKYLTRNIIKSLENKNESFLKWSYHKPKDMKNQYEKIGFNKRFEPYDWYIGTGEYVEDFEGDIQKEVLQYIANQQFSDNNYIFILDYNSNYLAHKNKHLIGRNAVDIYDKKAYKTIEKIINIARKEGTAYLDYTHIRPLTNKEATKTSYIRGVQNWQWAMGIGFYQEDVNKLIKIQKEVLDKRFEEDLYKLLFLSLSLTTLLLVLSVRISKFLETRFAQYRNQIKEHLEEITNQQNILAQQSKMAAIGTMIGNIAHQWRQPLSVITVGTTGIQIQNELGTLEKDGINKTCERINRNAQYLSKTIDDFSKYIKGDRVLSLFNLKLHIDDVLLLLEATLKNNSINVVLDIKDNIEVKGYPNELTQCLINICMNANDALLNQDIEDRNLFISSSSKKNFVEIKVRDNAGGIPQDIIKKIFDPYFTTKHQSQGTGLGLHMSYKLIVEGIEGTLNVQNVDFEYQDTKYTGAEFIICIPV